MSVVMPSTLWTNTLKNTQEDIRMEFVESSIWAIFNVIKELRGDFGIWKAAATNSKG